MTQCLKKPPRSLYKPRTGASLGKGSHKPSKRLVEPLIRVGQETKRTYGFCTAVGCVGVCSDRGVCRGVCVQGGGLLVREQGGGHQAGVRLAVKIDPLPPHPAHGVGGVRNNFSPDFSGICKLAI